MRLTSIDGIRAFAADGPPPFSAGLLFGVGRRDESFLRGGLTHLVEHLTMRTVGRTALAANASVDLTATEFTATGPVDQVADFLSSVCRALADLPLDQLAVEADILRAEGGPMAPPGVATLLERLYGLDGIGLAAVSDPALRSLTAEDVREWARRWFCRQNAALWASGPGLEELTLPLPDGAVPDRAPQGRRTVPTPAWTADVLGNGVVLGAEVAAGPALPTTTGILRARLEDQLRHRRGLAYSATAEALPVSADRRLVVLSADVRPGQEDLAASVLWAEVRRLADEGPGEGDLEHERALLAAYLADPRSAVEEVRAQATAVVTGIPVQTPGELRTAAGAWTPDAVREAAAAVRDAAVLALPMGSEAAPAGLERMPEWSVEGVTGREFRPRRKSFLPRGARLVVGDEGASLVQSPDERLTVRWADTVGLVRTWADEWLLVGRDGTTVRLAAADWRDGARAVELARAAVRSDLQAVGDDVAAERAVLLFRAPVHRVREAVGVSRLTATLVSNDDWTALTLHDDLPAEVQAKVVAEGIGGRPVALILRQGHADLEYLLLAKGRELDRHIWESRPGDPRVLADAVGRDPQELAEVLAASGSPSEVLARFVPAVGLPDQVPGLLAGREVPGAEQVTGQGFVGGLRAAVRGDYAPAPGSGSWLDRWAQVSRDRPPWYRAVNAVEAVGFGLLAWYLVASAGGDLVGWRGALAGGLALLALACLWDTRPPRRVGPERQAGDTGGGAALSRAPSDGPAG